MNIGVTNLYILDNTKTIRNWSISVIDNVIQIEHGQLNGAQQRKYESVTDGKGGRDVGDQIRSRVASRIRKQVDKGYCTSIMEAEKGTTNRLGLLKPMLAQPFNKVKNIEWSNAFAQYKYDGHRCIMVKRDGKVTAYTRNGKELTAIDHLTERVKHMIPNGWYLDGELYAHNTPLQSITSWVKKKQENTGRIEYRVYDTITNESFHERYKALRSLPSDSFVKAVPTIWVDSENQAMAMLDRAIILGYEGLIIRHSDAGYEDGKRSKSLVKLKRAHDANYLIIEIDESTDGWGILRCIDESGNEFSVSAPGDMGEKYDVSRNPERYIGRYVRVEFSNLTKDGIPFHPVATNYIDWD